MDILKEFMQRFRKLSFKEVYIILNIDIFPQLVNYIEVLIDIKFEDGSYQTYYGEIKNVITSFLTYFSSVIDDVIQDADRCAHVMDRNELIELIDRTIDIHQSRQIYYGRKFLPVRSSTEKEAYEEIEEMYKQYMDKLYELKRAIEKLDKQEKVDDFAEDHFKVSLKETSELFKMSHVFISMMLADKIDRIKVSLEELHLRAQNNLRKLQAERNETLQMLLQQLYNKNKELLQVTRKNHKNSITMAEANSGIQRIRDKIEQYTYDAPFERTQEEISYWEDRLKDFYQIAGTLMKLKKEQEDVAKQEEIYNSLQTTELPGSKRECWMNMGTNFAERNKYLKGRIIEAAKPLITFFAIQGNYHMRYKDYIGEFYVDEYNHKVYQFDYGMTLCHMNCEGDLKQVSEKDVPYFDAHGRYVLSPEGEKVYQCAPCTSTYKLTDAGLLEKTTKDCGHSEKINHDCWMHIKDPRSVEILPEVEKVDIKGTLDPEVVRYLWDSFGHILPYVLHDVGLRQSKNPIHHLAHCLLLYKYNKKKCELRQKQKEAQEYRANIFKERKDQATASSKAWKSKQVKRRKPEESYDDDDQIVHNAATANQVFEAAASYTND